MKLTAEKTLGEVCESIVYGVTASADFEATSGPKFLRITDITDHGVDWSRVPHCVVSHREERDACLHDGDIVVARTGGTVGKSFLVKSPPPRSVSASYLLRLRPLVTYVVPEYLSQFLGSAAYWSQLQDAARGAAQPNVNATTLSGIRLRVPSIANQRRIAAELKAQLAAVETARKAAQAQASESTALANAVIRESVRKSDQRSLGEVLAEVKLSVGADWAHYPVLGATRDGLAPAKEPVGKHPERYKPVRCGTVFYNPMRILIGSIAMVDSDDTEGITSPDYVVLRGREGRVDSRWFYYWLRSPLGERCIASLARGAVRERMLFNRLAEGTIELPSFYAQQRASQALARIRPLRTAIDARLADLDALPARLLAQAFDPRDQGEV